MYLVFAWTEGEPEGGVNDLLQVFTTEEEALDFVRSLMTPVVRGKKNIHTFEWQLVKMPTMECMLDSYEFIRYCEDATDD